MSTANGFKRVLPLRTAISTSAGLASAAINFLACVEIAEYAGGASAWLALLVAGLLIVLAGANFSELNGMYPSSAAIRVWVRRGINDNVSMVTGFVYATTVIFVIAADAFVLGHVFQAAVPNVSGLIWIALLLGLVTWINLRGIRLAGLVQDGNGLLLLTTLVIFSFLVLLHPHVPLTAGRLFHLGPNWLEAVAVGIFIYVGFEWVTPLAEEFEDSRVIPKGMFIALGLIAIGFGLFTLALAVVFPNAEALKHSLVPQLIVGLHALGPLGFWWMVVVSLTTAMTTFNGGLATASRFVYALARERVLPSKMARLNVKLVPQNALLLLSFLSLGLAILVYLTGQYLFLINAGAAVESFMYAITAIVVANLRKREPGSNRPFHSWGVPWLSWVMAVVFAGLGIGSLLAPSGEHGFPGPLVFLVLLVAASQIYVWKVVPRLKAQKRGMAKAVVPKR